MAFAVKITKANANSTGKTVSSLLATKKNIFGVKAFSRVNLLYITSKIDFY